MASHLDQRIGYWGVHLPTATFAVAKYYRPLSSKCPVAARLYSRIVNVPCHPGMAAIDDATILRFFRALPGGDFA